MLDRGIARVADDLVRKRWRVFRVPPGSAAHLLLHRLGWWSMARIDVAVAPQHTESLPAVDIAALEAAAPRGVCELWSVRVQFDDRFLPVGAPRYERLARRARDDPLGPWIRHTGTAFGAPAPNPERDPAAVGAP